MFFFWVYYLSSTSLAFYQNQIRMKRFIVVLFCLLGFSLTFSSYGQVKPGKLLTAQEISNLIDSVSASLKKHYIFPDKADAMAKYKKVQLRKGVYKKLSDPQQLAQQINADIRWIHYDAHLHIVYEPQMLAPKVLSPEELTKARKEELAAEKENNFNFQKIEILPGNVGYFLFNGFTSQTAAAKPTLNAALTFLSNAKVLMIDLRFNGGGSSIDQLASYFFKDKTHLFDMVSTFSKDTLSIYTDPSSTNGLLLAMPIYIITSKNTASAAEAFTASMQALKRARVVGDTTLGTSHLTGIFSLGNGFIARVPFSRPVSTSIFKDWEGTGVIPDIVIAEQKGLGGVQEIIYNELMQKAASDREKRAIQWAINDLKAKNNLPNPNIELLNKYVGAYSGGINFFVENGGLQCKNPERSGNDVFKLKPVTDHIFILDENVQVEFVKDLAGNYSSMSMLWKNGSLTKKSRTF